MPVTLANVELRGAPDPEILTRDALAFVAALTAEFQGTRDALLAARRERQRAFDAGERPDFLRATARVREAEWRVAPIPADLEDRRVEITGPADRKMMINALNSGARVFMADFEDSSSPTWQNVVQGQRNVRDAVRGTIEYEAPESRKLYRLGERPATLMLRPRGLHLDEAHVLVEGRALPAALFDFGLFCYWNARELVAKGTAPYLYLPKLESHLEARLWNGVFQMTQDSLGIPRGTLRATVLIETLPAAFEMDEILYELKDHSAGLNCGRWDYIFSFIKKLRNDPSRVLPDRSQLSMDSGFLKPYVQLLIQTCHRRGAHAMGGMAAQIPIKGDPERNEAALEKVRADKRRELAEGHDGTWVAHPGLVSVATEIFDAGLPGPNQIERRRDDVKVSREDLLRVPEGTRTDEGLRHNLRVGVQYLEAWLRGNGCVPIYHLMEDAATAEISRSQVWQWLRHGAKSDDGRRIDVKRFRRTLDEELERVREEVGPERFRGGRFPAARRLFEELTTATQFEEFLTLPAYALLEGVRGER
jgi:malate synthase